MQKNRIFSTVIIILLCAVVAASIKFLGYYAIFFFLGLGVIIFFVQKIKYKKPGDYENPFVNVNQYRLPLKPDARMPVVNYSNFKANEGETLFYASETCQKGNEGVILITNQRGIIKNLTSRQEFLIKDVIKTDAVSNSAVRVETKTDKFYILIHNSQVKYLVAVIEWAAQKAQNN